MSLAGAVSRARQLHASVMLDTVTVARVTRGTISETTGRYADTETTIYAGPARIKAGSPTVSDVAGIAATVANPTMDLPHDAPDDDSDPGAVLPGDVVRVATGQLAGTQLRVVAPVPATTATCWRYQVEVIS